MSRTSVIAALAAAALAASVIGASSARAQEAPAMQIYFPVGGAVVTPSMAVNVDAVIQMAKAQPGKTVVLIGRCDPADLAARSLKVDAEALSTERVQAVIAALRKAGLPETVNIEGRAAGMNNPPVPYSITDDNGNVMDPQDQVVEVYFR